MIIKALLILIIFISGLTTGLFYEIEQEIEKIDDKSLSSKEIVNFTDETPETTNNNKYVDEIKILKIEIENLKKELSQAEDKLLENKNKPRKRGSSISDTLNLNNLVTAGIDEVIAQEIIRRKDENDYKYLELRDKAVRGGYDKSAKFRKELHQLKKEEYSIREEYGDDVYDRYLYATGNDNRIAVKSIMQNSQAEYAGIKVGDIIYSYEEQRIFSWHGLNKATTQGMVGESVIVNVERNNELLNILVSRGPLGIKLEVSRVKP